MAGIATRQAYGKALAELGRVDDRIVVLDADLSKSTMTAGFAKDYPERFLNMGIAEQNMMAVAAGLSTTGKVPFASTFAMFAAGRAFEIVRNSIAYPKLNVKIAATHAGLTVGEDGASHQTVEDLALMCSLPNMTVINPCDDIETEQVIKAAANYVGPMYIRLTRGAVPTVNDADYKFEIGKGCVLREGTDGSLIATGVMVGEAIKAANMLLEEGINVSVVNISTLKPIDEALIIKESHKGKIVTCEEHSVYGGLNSIVSQIVAREGKCKVRAVAVQDTFGESGSPADLLLKYKLTAKEIYNRFKSI